MDTDTSVSDGVASTTATLPVVGTGIAVERLNLRVDYVDDFERTLMTGWLND